MWTTNIYTITISINLLTIDVKQALLTQNQPKKQSVTKSLLSVAVINYNTTVDKPRQLTILLYKNNLLGSRHELISLSMRAFSRSEHLCWASNRYTRDLAILSCSDA